MDNDYRKKLLSLGVYFGNKDFNFKSSNKEIKKKLAGTIGTNSFGEFFYSDQNFQKDYIHGSIRFEEVFGNEPLISLPDTDENIKLNECVFLDTETTGLSTSGGTFAFMVGIGFFENQKFVLRQYFLKDPMEEEAMLLDLENLLFKFSTLVTYNGASFDVPILKSRFKYHRIPYTLTQKLHVDLLKYARMLFRYQFESRSLKSIETNVIQFQRSEEEIPGFMAPLIYQEYLKTKDIGQIQGVFYHNAMDIVSLAALIKIINQISILEGDHFSRYETLNYSMARQYEKKKHVDNASKYYLKALEQNDLPPNIKLNCLLSLADLFKKTNKIHEAILLWEQASAFQNIDALVELAKVYEHRYKEYQQAMNCCKNALLILENDVNSTYKGFHLQQIHHRLDRLKTKANNGKI